MCCVALMLQNAVLEAAVTGGSARDAGAPRLVRQLLEETDIEAKWTAFFHTAPMNRKALTCGNSDIVLRPFSHALASHALPRTRTRRVASTSCGCLSEAHWCVESFQCLVFT